MDNLTKEGFINGVERLKIIFPESDFNSGKTEILFERLNKHHINDKKFNEIINNVIDYNHKEKLQIADIIDYKREYKPEPIEFIK